MRIVLRSDYKDPEKNYFEVVERKGMGHPDTLADKLAELCSQEYSKYCLQNFGCVLHHNFDKLYIGAGKFIFENNQVKMYDKIKVFLNGRASITMNGQKIDLNTILSPVIKDYLKTLLPHLDVENDLEINLKIEAKFRKLFVDLSVSVYCALFAGFNNPIFRNSRYKWYRTIHLNDVIPILGKGN